MGKNIRKYLLLLAYKSYYFIYSGKPFFNPISFIQSWLKQGWYYPRTSKLFEEIRKKWAFYSAYEEMTP